MSRCKKKEKFECATLNVRSPNWQTNYVSNQTKRLTPQEICKLLKYKPPAPPICVNNYTKKNRRKKKKAKLQVDKDAQIILGKHSSTNGTESNTEYPTTNSNAATSVSNVKQSFKTATSYDHSMTKNSSATTSSPQIGNTSTSENTNSNDTTDDSTEKVCCENCACQQSKPVEYIEYDGIGKRRRHRMDYMTGPPLPIICDTTPNYYAKVDAQKTTYAFYCNYLNCKLWKLHLPKPPILLGACIHHLHCFVNENDYLYKYLKLKEKLEAQQKNRNKQK